jgi:hypothetical protein
MNKNVLANLAAAVAALARDARVTATYLGGSAEVSTNI